MSDIVTIGDRTKFTDASVACYLDGSGTPVPISQTNPLPVSGGGGGGGGNSNAGVVTTYTATSAFTIGVVNTAIGDIITLTQIVSTGTTPTEVASFWYNATQAAQLTSAPNFANLALEGTQALTAAQLSAMTLNVNLPTGAATSTLQSSANTRLDQLHTDLSTVAQDGTDATGVPVPTGGGGIRGWLSGIYSFVKTGVIAKLQDGAGNAITSSTLSGKVRLDVNLAAGAVPGATAPSWADQFAGVDGGGLLRPISTDTTGRVNVNSNATLQTGSAVIGKVGIDQTTPGTTNAVSVGSSISSLPALTAGSAVIGKVGIDQTTPGTTNAVSVGSSISSLPALTAGSAVIGKVGIDQTTPGTTNAVQVTNAFALETGGNLTTIATNTAPLIYAQGSTTSGQVGNLGQGAVTTAAPGYTNAKTNPLSLTTAGSLRMDLNSIASTAIVNGGLAGTVAIGGAAAHSAPTTTNPATVGGKVVPITAATVDTTLTAGDASNLPITTGYQTIVKQNGTAELDWAANASFTPTVWASSSTPTVLRAASGTASVRTYVSALQLSTDALGAALSYWILDGLVSVTSVTIATPGVFTNSGTNDFKAGDAVVFQSLGTITGITANTVYYITATSLTATTFTVAATIGGTALQITGSTAATNVYRVIHQGRLQTAALPIVSIPLPTPIRTAPNVALSIISSSTQTGTIYPSAQGYYGF